MNDQDLLERKKELEFLMQSHINIKKKKGLSEIGVSFLEGLEKAYHILFPIMVQGDRE